MSGAWGDQLGLDVDGCGDNGGTGFELCLDSVERIVEKAVEGLSRVGNYCCVGGVDEGEFDLVGFDYLVGEEDFDFVRGLGLGLGVVGAGVRVRVGIGIGEKFCFEVGIPGEKVTKVGVAEEKSNSQVNVGREALQGATVKV